MIVMVRGNHGSGTSTVVRKLLALPSMDPQPVFGILGPRMPEAYKCTTPRPGTQPLYVLGPYASSATAGCDYVTKLGVIATVEFLERYRKKGDILFESIMTSVRIMEPSIGKWIAAHKEELAILTLTTTFDQCVEAIETRKKASTAGTRWNSKHLQAQQVMFERVTAQYKERGFRMEYASRDAAPSKILGLMFFEEPRRGR